MKPIFEKLWQAAQIYLDTRVNDEHTKISIRYAFELMEQEGGDGNIVIPAVILHDVGWKKVPVDLQLQAFGPKAKNSGLNRTHEVEGVKIARNILKQVGYDNTKAKEILEIIDGHDSRKSACSLNDQLVKDADKLWRFSKLGFWTDLERFEETFDESLFRLKNNIAKWFFTNTAKEIAAAEIKKRASEKQK
jgi:HD superfamily phosphodiesterase